MLSHTDAQFDEVLTKRAVALLEDRADFAVINGAIPMIPTGGVLTGNYKVWNAGDFRRRNIEKRQAGSDFKRVNLGLKKKTFSLDQAGYEITIDDRDNIPGEMEDISAKQIEDAYANLDMELSALLTGANFTYTNAIGNNWNTANGTPIEDVQTAIDAVKGRIGVAPDSMLLSEDVYNALKNNAEILARLRTDADKIITLEKLAGFFGLKNIYVMAGSKTTSADGQADAFGKISAGAVLVYYKGNGAGASTPSAVKCFYNDNESKGMAIIETYRDNQKRSDVVRVIQDFQIVITMVEGAQLLTGTLS